MEAAYRESGTIALAAESLGVGKDAFHRACGKHRIALKNRRVTPKDRARIAEYYTETSSADFDLLALANELGRTKPFVCRIAGQMGLSEINRPCSDKTRAGQSERSKEWHKGNDHPRGMLGKPQSEKAKAAVSKASLAKWKHDKATGTGHMAPARRQARSDLAAARMASRPASSNYSRTRSGKRDDLDGLFVRSSWEANYARYLNWMMERGGVEWWEYEPDTFWFEGIKRGTRFYTPDFKVKYADKADVVYDEVKGWMDAKSKTRLSRMAKYYPTVVVNVIGAKEYRVLQRQLSRIIPNWEQSK